MCSNVSQKYFKNQLKTGNSVHQTRSLTKYSKLNHHNQGTEQDTDMDDASLTNSSTSPLISTSLVNNLSTMPVTASACTSLASSFMSTSGLDNQYKSSVLTFGNTLNGSLGNSLSNSINNSSTTSNGCAANNYLFNNTSTYNRHLNGFAPRYSSTNAFENSPLNSFNHFNHYNQYNNLLNTNTNVHSSHQTNNSLLFQYFTNSSVDEKASKVKND